MTVDFVLYLIRLVGHENAAVGVACTHFRLRALKGGEEFRVDESGFGVLDLLGNVAGQSEIGILVDGARDEARDISRSPKDLGEGARERGCGLDGSKMHFANVVPERCQRMGEPYERRTIR